MTLLTKEQIAERIALYETLADKMAAVEALDAALPNTVPPDLVIESDHLDSNAIIRATHIVRAAWPALRAATMKVVLDDLAAAEEAVRKFEAGEEV